MNPVVVTLNGYAYETTANMPISAGQTKDTEDASARERRYNAG